MSMRPRRKAVPLGSRTRLRRVTVAGQCAANHLRSDLRTMTRATTLRKPSEGALSRLTILDGLLCVTCR